MSVIFTESFSKSYRLGLINRRYLYKDMQSFSAKSLGRPDSHAEVDLRVSDTKEGIIWALNNVNIEIKDGDVVGGLALNGSGKSTLLKILSRFTSPTKGTAKIKGQVASLPEVVDECEKRGHFFDAVPSIFVRLGFQQGDFLGAESSYTHCLTPPCYLGMITEDVQKVISTVQRFLK